MKVNYQRLSTQLSASYLVVCYFFYYLKEKNA